MAIKSFRGETVKVEHFRDSKDGPVTSVVNTSKDGCKDIYSNSKGVLNSSDYGHKGYDSLGNLTVDRPEGQRSGREFKGYVLEWMSGLSFVELQQMEKSTTNEYVKRSARQFMRQVTNEELIISPKCKILHY